MGGGHLRDRHGLQSAVAHNGRRGSIVTYDAAAGRYEVRLDAVGAPSAAPEKLSIRPDNVLLAPAATAADEAAAAAAAAATVDGAADSAQRVRRRAA